MGHTSSPSLPGPVTYPGAQIPANNSFAHLSTPPASPTLTSCSVDKKSRIGKAWKYEGYKALSEWMASDDDFFVVRRFGTVNAHVILWMQHQIVSKETQLAELHQQMEKKPGTSAEVEGQNDSFNWDIDYLPERHNLMRELSALLLHYSQSYNRAARMETDL